MKIKNPAAPDASIADTSNAAAKTSAPDTPGSKNLNPDAFSKNASTVPGASSRMPANATTGPDSVEGVKKSNYQEGEYVFKNKKLKLGMKISAGAGVACCLASIPLFLSFGVIGIAMGLTLGIMLLGFAIKLRDVDRGEGNSGGM